MASCHCAGNAGDASSHDQSAACCRWLLRRCRPHRRAQGFQARQAYLERIFLGITRKAKALAFEQV
jgi:hypothetical protein